LTIAFPVYRKGFLKVIGALIQTALDRGHSVVLFWSPDEKKPGESVSESDLQAWPAARIVRHSHRAPLGPVLREHGAQALVVVSLYTVLRAYGHADELESLRAAGVRLFSVDYVLDTVTSDPEGYRVADVTFYSSEYQRQLHWSLMADRFARLGDRADWSRRSAVCGSVMMDQLDIVDRAAVRKRYGIGDDQPVVLFMSLKMEVPDDWRRLHWGRAWRVIRAVKALVKGHPAWVPDILFRHGYRKMLLATQRLCRRSGAALIVKSRKKNGDPPFLRRLADDFIYDEAVYPYTSLELMAIADLCVHFQSGAVLEAAFAGVPSLSVLVSQEHLKKYASFDELYGAEVDTLQNFPGVVTPVSYRDVAALLDRASLSDFTVDPEARRRYVTKFLGFDDTHSSRRVLESIERTVSGGDRA
jgi:hypothetical protein